MVTPQRVLLHDGFSVDVSATDQGALAALLRDWSELRPQLAEEAFELRASYVESDLPPDATPDGIWDTMLDASMRCLSAGNYELSCRFTWQKQDDPHVVTFHLEDGQSRGETVDG
jgi:hypothetical protein